MPEFVAAAGRLARLVLIAEEMRLIARRAQHLRQMTFAGMQVVGEAEMGQPHDAVGVREAPRPQRRA